ncbi:MAG: FHA domain-containing protein [Deltaproteobacteria bacterium]|nr:FHA domain-containing protein [Deltaproteobacteria bacterium]
MVTKCYWLDAPHGRVMISASKVLIGRSPDCTIVLEGPQISRYHVLLRLGGEGAELLPLGREPVLVNNVERRALTTLRGGDVIDVCGWTFRVGEAETEAEPEGAKTAWFLERARRGCSITSRGRRTGWAATSRTTSSSWTGSPRCSPSTWARGRRR